MKIEFESNTTSLPFANQPDVNEKTSDCSSPEVTKLLEEGIEAAQSGERAKARTILMRVTEADSKNENAWLWLASISEYPEELLVFLKNVLNINPNNERAIEWSKATEALMAKTFVQRGIDAAKNDQNSVAKQCFLQAIVHDSNSELAWLWLASVCNSPEERMSHLQKVLSINPENENASESLKSAKLNVAKVLLPKANQAALEGQRDEAQQILDEIILDAPEFEDAWMLKAHLTDSLEEKIGYFKKVLEINPENPLAKANVDSLSMFVKQSDDSVVAENEFIVEEFDEAEAEVEDSKEETPLELDSTENNNTESAIEDEVVELEVEAKNTDENLEEKPDLQLESEDNSDENLEEESNLQLESEDNSDENHSDEQKSIEKPVENFETSKFQNESEIEEIEEIEDSEIVSFHENSEVYEEPELMDHEVEIDEVEAISDANEFEYEEVVEETESFNSEMQNDDLDIQEQVAEQPPEFSYFDEAEVETSALPFTNQTDVENFDKQNVEQPLEFSNIEDDVRFHEQDSETQFDESAEDSKNDLNLEAEEAFEQQEENEVDETALEEIIEYVACGFCDTENDQKAFVCGSCKSVLTHSDLEILLSNEDVDEEAIQNKLDELEAVKNSVGVSADDLKLMSLGYLNLKQYRNGFDHLKAAAKKEPNDVMLSSQIDSLAIRISEIEEQAENLDAQPKSKNILVVDDSPTVRKLITGKLEKCGHTAISAVDGMDALAKINEVLPDLILLDITMPRMDGYQVCKLIRGNESTADVPIVMISGKDGFFDKVRGKMAGTDNYITKPFGPETLMMTVNQYLSE